MSEESLREMGPIDYIILEWPSEPSGDEVVPLLVDLVDRGIIRILDIAFVSKGDDGELEAIEISDLGPAAAAFGVFEGASSGLVDDEDSRRRPPRWSRGRLPRSWSGRTAGRRLSRSRCAGPVDSWSPAAASPCKPWSPRWMRLRPSIVNLVRGERPCPDYYAGSPAPPLWLAPPPP